MTNKIVEVILPFTPQEISLLHSYMEIEGSDNIGEFVIAALNYDLECQRLPLIDIKKCSFAFNQRIVTNPVREGILLTEVVITMRDDAHDIVQHMFEANGGAWVGAAMDFYATILEQRPTGRIESPLLRKLFG